MNRRQIRQTGVAAALAGAASIAPLSTANAASGNTTRKPRRLAKGATVRLIAPASNAGEDESIRFTVDLVQSPGFRVKEGKYLYCRNQYLAGGDRERAEDVNSMFDDDEVDAIFCTRGGYGTPRILPYLDYDLIAHNPKVFLGCSDNTAILAAMQVKSRLIGFHSANMGQNLSDYTLAEFKKVLLIHPRRRTSANPRRSSRAKVLSKEPTGLHRSMAGQRQGILSAAT